MSAGGDGVPVLIAEAWVQAQLLDDLGGLALSTQGAQSIQEGSDPAQEIRRERSGGGRRS